MSVVGFDFGNETCVIAVARRRGIDVLQNEVGNRKTKSYVAFSGKQRLIGDEGGAVYFSNFKNTFVNFKRFMGRRTVDPELPTETAFVPYKIVDLNSMVGFEANYDDKKETFLPEQVSAALFQKLKVIAEKGLEGQRVVDCVIGVPHYWTDLQRRSVLDAAYIAGLNVLRLMNETTAVALNYGILRPLPKDQENRVMFVDIGQCSTCVSVVAFSAGKLKVLSTAHDRNLGGRDFDKLLVDHFSAYIKEKYKMDVMSETKPRLKLFKECERVKRILSANSKVQFNVEYIMNDTDVKGEMDRTLWEELCKKSLLPRIQAVLSAALAGANLKPADLFAVEVVGGCTRIPCIQTELTSYLGKEVSKTCDSDESVARGCALQCAMISPSFRVRDFEVHDLTPYAVEVQWGPAPVDPSKSEIEHTSPLFTENNSIPSVKMISFKDRTQPFQLVARYADPAAVGTGTDPLIGRFVISGMPSAVDGQKVPKIKVRVKLNVHGVLSVTSAQLLHILEDAEDNTEMKPVETDSKVEDPAEEASKEEDEKKPEPAPETMDTSTDAEKTEEKAEEKVEEKKEKKAEETKDDPKKKRVKREELTVTATLVGGLDTKALQTCFEREVSMSHADKIIADTNEARNALESYVLEMRAKVEDELSGYVKDTERTKFLSDCTEMEDWLYDEGENAQKSEYKKKLAELAVVGDGAIRREWEHSHREPAVATLKSCIGKWEKLASTTDEKFAHIEEPDRKKVADACAAADQWLCSEENKQGKLNKTEEPVLTCDLLTKRFAALDKLCAPIMNKPVPKPPAPEPEKKEEKKAADATPPAADATSTEDAPADAAVDAAATDAPAADGPEDITPKAEGAARMDVD